MTTDDLEHRCSLLKDKLQQPDFLANRGLGNEVGFYTFCYEATRELEVRSFIAQLKDDASLPCRIVEYNLYDILLDILKAKRILNAVPKQEEKLGQEKLMKQLQKIATPEEFAKVMAGNPHAEGDVVFISGVGEVYPFMRVHNILDNIQPAFADVPVVVFYPGKFTGQSLSLFNKLNDGNYYRAFDLI